MIKFRSIRSKELGQCVTKLDRVARGKESAGKSNFKKKKKVTGFKKTTHGRERIKREKGEGRGRN